MPSTPARAAPALDESRPARDLLDRVLAGERAVHVDDAPASDPEAEHEPSIHLDRRARFRIRAQLSTPNGVGPGMSITTLHESALLSVREWRLPPDDEAWMCENAIDPAGPIVVFPRTAVLIKRADARPVLATPNLALLYDGGAVYEREARDPRGDECLYIRVFDRELPPGTHVPTDSATYLSQHLLARYLRGDAVDPFVAETTAAELVDRVVGRARTVAVSAAHRRLAAAAEELLTATVRESPSLHEVATQLNVSPFHLARVFRRVTGFGLHEYRRQLRLRIALGRLPARGRLTELAFELGFASHSHFTEAFRSEFGLPPSALAA